MTSFPYVVIRDTREKDNNGWFWRKSKYCAGTVDGTMPTGDYTLEGMEDYLIIERKGSIAEWAKNINEARFARELERLDAVQHPWILLEFTMRDIMNYPVGSSIPRYKWKSLKFRGSYILKRTTEIMMQHRAKIILCGDSGKETASNIFKRTVEYVKTRNA